MKIFTYQVITEVSVVPILFLTNVSWVLFILMSCVLLPQLSNNLFDIKEGNAASDYFTKYGYRFLLIVFSIL